MKGWRGKDVVQKRLKVSSEVSLGIILDDLHGRLEAVHSTQTIQRYDLRSHGGLETYCISSHFIPVFHSFSHRYNLSNKTFMMSTDLDLGPLERLLDICCPRIRHLVSYS